MSGSNRNHLRPRSYLTERGRWPDGPFSAHTPSLVERCAAMAARLDDAMAVRALSAPALAAAAHVTVADINELVTGERIPRWVELTALELALGVRLWPTLQEMGRWRQGL